MWVISAFVVGILCQIGMIWVGYSMDKESPNFKLYVRVKLPDSFKSCFFIYDKEKRNNFLIIALIIQLFSFFLITLSTVVFIISIFLQSDDVFFISTVISFGLSGIAAVAAIAYMAISFIEEIMKDRREDDF